MTNEMRIRSFADAVDKGNTDLLETIYEEAVSDGVPVIRRDTQSFLKTLLCLLKPASILEAGTAVGFSSLFMAQYTDPSCRITTIENYEKRIVKARENFRRAGMEDRIGLIEGDAWEILKELNGTYDLIFMDAAKAQYIRYLPEVKRLMRPGSVLLSDNIFFDGNIALPRCMVERRDRTIHERMREYIFALMNDEELNTAILQTGDGLAFSVMKEPAAKDPCLSAKNDGK